MSQLFTAFLGSSHSSNEDDREEKKVGPREATGKQRKLPVELGIIHDFPPSTGGRIFFFLHIFHISSTKKPFLNSTRAQISTPLFLTWSQYTIDNDGLMSLCPVFEQSFLQRLPEDLRIATQSGGCGMKKEVGKRGEEEKKFRGYLKQVFYQQILSKQKTEQSHHTGSYTLASNVKMYSKLAHKMIGRR